MRFGLAAGERARHGKRACSSIAIVLASLAFAGTAQAQGASAHPSCNTAAADACQQAVDFFHYMAPQLGTAGKVSDVRIRRLLESSS